MVMPAPMGPITCGEVAISNKLIACDWFPKFLKLDSPTDEEMLAHIYFDKVPDPDIVDDEENEVISFPDLVAQRPFVCLWPAQPAGRFAWNPGGGLFGFGMDYRIYIETNDSDATDDTDFSVDPERPDEMFRWWLNMVGTLLVGHNPDAAVGSLKGLILQQSFALSAINSLDIWHVTRKQSGLGTYFAATAILETGTQPT